MDDPRLQPTPVAGFDLLEGYRETEIGNLPEEWQIAKVKDVAKVITGKTPSTKEGRYWEGAIPFVTPVDLQDTSIGITARTITEEALEVLKSLPSGTVTVSCIGHIGKVGVTEAPVSVTNQQINSVLPDENIASGWYLAYAFIHSKPRLKDQAAITTVSILNKSNFEAFKILLPPLPEQKAIAHILRTVQRDIESTEKVIEASRELKRSLMTHLFTYGPVPVDEAEQVSLKETEIGSMPEQWEMVTLEEAARIERGKFSHRPRNDPRFYGGAIPFIQTGDVARTQGHITTYSQTLNELGLSVSRIFPKGTIVLTIAANIGHTGVLAFDSAFPDSLVGITPKASIDAMFLEHYLRTQKDEMDRLAPRGTQKNINIQFLKPWPVAKPPLTEQEEIVRILSSVNTKIKAEENRKETLKILFKSLLHNLMTGKVRVNDLDMSAVEEMV